VALQGTLAPLITGLARLAQRRHITLRQTVDSGVRVHMDGQDLQEMVGNLLDNALRWGKSDVHIRLQAQSEMLLLVVSDDGPGMTPQECQAAVQRGKRLDEQRSGSGLGLAIVTDLVTLYHGQMRLLRGDWSACLYSLYRPFATHRAAHRHPHCLRPAGTKH
jgi:signal transduction histidine kinase